MPPRCANAQVTIPGPQPTSSTRSWAPTPAALTSSSISAGSPIGAAAANGAAWRVNWSTIASRWAMPPR